MVFQEQNAPIWLILTSCECPCYFHSNTGSLRGLFSHRRKEVEDQSGEVNTWKYENGRRYATTGHYYLPNDEPEIQRLKEQHWLLTQVKGGELHKAPLPLKKDGAKVLDIGCGSGIWCTQMAEFYPDAEIAGMDLSNIQPEDKPSNVEWIVHDMEKEWPFPEQHFDFVHLSLVHGCVANWNRMMETIVQYAL